MKGSKQSPNRNMVQEGTEIELPEALSFFHLKGGHKYENVVRMRKELGCSLDLDKDRWMITVTPNKTGFKGYPAVREALMLSPFEVRIPKGMPPESLAGLRNVTEGRFGCSLELRWNPPLVVVSSFRLQDREELLELLRNEMRDNLNLHVEEPIVLVYDSRGHNHDKIRFEEVRFEDIGGIGFRPRSDPQTKDHPHFPFDKLRDKLSAETFPKGYNPKVQFRTGKLCLKTKTKPTIESVGKLRELMNDTSFVKRNFVAGVDSSVKEFSSLRQSATEENTFLFVVTIKRGDKQRCLTMVDLQRTTCDIIKNACTNLGNGLGLLSVEGDKRRMYSLECWNVRKLGTVFVFLILVGSKTTGYDVRVQIQAEEQVQDADAESFARECRILENGKLWVPPRHIVYTCDYIRAKDRRRYIQGDIVLDISHVQPEGRVARSALTEVEVSSRSFLDWAARFKIGDIDVMPVVDWEILFDVAWNVQSRIAEEVDFQEKAKSRWWHSSAPIDDSVRDGELMAASNSDLSKVYRFYMTNPVIGMEIASVQVR